VQEIAGDAAPASAEQAEPQARTDSAAARTALPHWQRCRTGSAAAPSRQQRPALLHLSGTRKRGPKPATSMCARALVRLAETRGLAAGARAGGRATCTKKRPPMSPSPEHARTSDGTPTGSVFLSTSCVVAGLQHQAPLLITTPPMARGGQARRPPRPPAVCPGGALAGLRAQARCFHKHISALCWLLITLECLAHRQRRARTGSSWCRWARWAAWCPRRTGRAP